MHRSALKFSVVFFSFIMMIYPFVLQMGVEEGTLKGAIEVYAPVKNIQNYSWIQSINRIYKAGNESIYLDNFSMNNLIYFANKSIAKYMPLEEGRFFENKHEMVIGKSLLKDLRYVGYDVGIGKTVKFNIEKVVNNKTIRYEINEKIVGILPSALSHFGSVILMPYNSINSSDLLLTEYVITPKKGISLQAVYDYLQANSISAVEPNNPVDVSMFRIYIWVLGFFSFTAGFLFVLLLYEHENDYFFREYAIIQIFGGDKMQYLKKYFAREFLFLIISYIIAFGALFIAAPYIYGYLNDTFNYIVFSFNLTLASLLLPLSALFTLFVYQSIVLKFKLSRFSLIKFIREGWKL